jgi:histidinol-phosphatase
MSSKSKYLEVALEAVKKTEKIIKKYYFEEVKTEYKWNNSPVTIADKESEKIIVEEIKKAFPNHSFLGEEFGDQNKGSEFTWIIDPIDGTKNYIRGIPLFATELALMKGDDIILGISNAPILNECLYAEKGKGAFLNGNKIVVSKIESIKDVYMSYGGINYFEKKNILEPFLKLNRETHAHRAMGDCWSFHLLAQGKIDLMAEADVRIWDIAGLSCIVEEAGGKCTDIYGNKITKEVNTILASNGLVHEKALGYFKSDLS